RNHNPLVRGSSPWFATRSRRLADRASRFFLRHRDPVRRSRIATSVGSRGDSAEHRDYPEIYLDRRMRHRNCSCPVVVRLPNAANFQRTGAMNKLLVLLLALELAGCATFETPLGPLSNDEVLRH